MSLSRRSMRPSGNIEPEPTPAFVAQLREYVKGNTRDENAAIICAIHDAEAAINRKLEKIMARLDDLLDAVAAQQTQIDSLITLTGGLHKQVIEAMGATITPSQQMRIDAIFASVADNADDITAAIKANTVEATAGAVTGGPSLADLRGATGVGQQAPIDPGPAADLPAADPATVVDPTN